MVSLRVRQRVLQSGRRDMEWGYRIGELYRDVEAVVVGVLEADLDIANSILSGLRTHVVLTPGRDRVGLRCRAEREGVG